MNQDAQFQKRLLATFAVEAREHLKGITSALIELEREDLPERRQEIVERVFREAHSLKGAARTVNMRDVEALCQAMEGLFSAMKRGEESPSPGLFDLLQRARDLLERMLRMQDAEGEGEGAVRRGIIEELIQASKGGGEHPGSGVPPTDAPPAAQPSPRLEETVRVPTARLALLLLLSEEMVSAKLAAGQHAAQVRQACSAFAVWRKEWGRVSTYLQQSPRGEGGEAARLREFFDWNASFVTELAQRCDVLLRSAVRDGRALGGMVDNLLDEVKTVMMFPFSSLLEAFPKIVRDLTRDYGKEADLVLRGEEIEIDRRILEEMKDPFVHLARNSIGHGIESPEEREALGKPRRGEFRIFIQPRDGKAEIVVGDDGAGIATGRLRSALQRLGVVSGEQAEAMSDADLLPFVFDSGVSTSQFVDEISGRGLGLAIVRERVEKLGGTVSLRSEPGRGTTFTILLPLSLATYRGLLVRVAERLFVFPSPHVERAVRVRPEEIGRVQNMESITRDGRVIPLARLGALLDLPAGGGERAQLQAVVVTAAETSVGFVVDEVLSEQEVLQKNFGPQLSRVRNIAGATLLGSGRIVPILNVADLMKAAARGSVPPPSAGPGEAGGGGRRKRILVVEDSITTRTLLRNILEAAGYDVTTAVDGLDGFTQLKSGRFDLVVTDVDMPRMDGFDLTRRIRADEGTAELPVVLVTALGSREDRERGIDAGANAYIVKGSFDQSNLLDAVQRLC